ncbi:MULTISPECIES: hypothetical protein [Rhizobium]|uniref:hypothetical protein n=1 Tax=Rhizobium phaseoli TaxID=396 RepID=UPI000A1BFFA3|nr:hypothetical protein [Rhizobium phaseoli]ARM16412.1 hypothetical protein Bra5_PD00872 [Rhizobium phaseoli Brasil 5]MDK4725631.1 hypothetical protein [Rhizobium phaseoli]
MRLRYRQARLPHLVLRQPTFSAFKGDVTAQSQAMPAHMLKGSIAVVGDFFNNRNLLTQR